MRTTGLIRAVAIAVLAFMPHAARAEPAWLGAEVETVTPAMMTEKGLAVPFGARVTSVDEESPAAAAGLAPDDVVISINGTAVPDAAAFHSAVAKLAAGAVTDIVRIRGKAAPETVKLTLLATPPVDPSGKPRLGVETVDLTGEEMRALGLRESGGVRVTRVLEGLAADRGGMAVEDIVVAIDGAPVWNGEIFTDALGKRKPGDIVRFMVLRGDERREITVSLGARPGEAAADGPPTQLMLDTGGHMASIAGLAFTQDGNLLVSAGQDKVVRVWDWRRRKTVRTIRGDAESGQVGKISAMALAPDGQRLAVAAGGVTSIRLYDLASGRLEALLPGDSEGTLGLAFSPDGKRLVSAGFSNTAVVWDVGARSLLHRLEGHGAPIYAVKFTNDGEYIVTGSEDASVRLWNAATGELVREMTGHHDKVYAIAIHPKDAIIASGDWSGGIRLWDARTGTVLRAFTNHGAVFGALAFAPDGSRLLSACGQNCRSIFDGLVFDVATGNQVATYSGHENVVLAAAISPDGQYAATGDFFGNIDVWDLATGWQSIGPDGKPIRLSATGASVFTAGFSPDGGSIAWGYLEDGPYQLTLRLPGGKSSLGTPEQTSGPSHAATTHESYTLRRRQGGAYGHDAILDVVKDGTVVASLERGPTDGYEHQSYTFTADGKTIVSGGAGGHIAAFDLAAVETAAKGGTLKGADLDGLARLFIGHESDVLAVAPSPDGKYLISGSADQTVRLWNLVTGEPIVTLFYGRDDEWVMWTPQGYYTGSPGGGALVGWQINRGPGKEAEYVRGAQLRSKLLRPDIVERAIVLASATEAVNEAGVEKVSVQTLLAATPPIIFAAAPKEAAGGRTHVTVTARKSDIPVKSFAISVRNEKGEETKVEAKPVVPPPGTPVPEKGATLKIFEVPLFQGKNVVRVVAANAAGESEPSLAEITHNGEGALDKRQKLWVLAVGVDKYPDAKHISDPATGKTLQYKDLSFAGADARAFADVAAAGMIGTHREKDVTLLVNGDPQHEPNRANILAALERIRASAGDNDTVAVLLAGHGENWQGGRYHFLPTDLKRKVISEIGDNVIDWEKDIQPAIAGARGRKLLFVDACHSGNAYNRTLLAAAETDRFVAFSAARGEELASEFPQEGHGVFTYMLVEGLKGDPPALDPLEKGVTVYTLGIYVNLKVRERTNGRQTPEFRSGQGSFVLVRR